MFLSSSSMPGKLLPEEQWGEKKEGSSTSNTPTKKKERSKGKKEEK